MAYQFCKWCDGRGCIACNEERKKDIAAGVDHSIPKPIFTARLDDPADMELTRNVIGFDALKHAFGPGGGGMQEVEHNAAVYSVIQLLRKQRVDDSSAGSHSPQP